MHSPALVSWLADYWATLGFHRGGRSDLPEGPVRGTGWGPSGWVHRRLARMYERAGVKGKRPTHALRHTLATDRAEAAVRVSVAQRILGHASPVLTLRVYTHATMAGV